MITRTLLRVDTKANRMATAEFSARTWRSHSDTFGSARCTVCGHWVPTERRLIAGELETWGVALSGAVFEHLETGCAVTK